MRPLRQFTVEPSLPDELSALLEIAYNLRWSWDGSARDLFRRLDPDEWEACYHNPVALLGRVRQERLLAASREDGFLAQLSRVHEQAE